MKKKSKFFVVLLIIIGLFVVIMSFSTFITLQPGEKGVIFKPWTGGLDKEHILNEGVHIIAPWNNIIKFNVREQVIDFNKENPQYGVLDVIDKNGLKIFVEVTVRYSPQYDKIGYIYEKFGGAEEYKTKLIIPEVRSTVRQIMGQYDAEEIYSTKRLEIEQKIIDETKSILSKNYIDMKALLIRSITIPDNLIKAIEEKLTKQQEAIAYDYIIDKKKKIKLGKIIDAQGIAEYNRIVNESMTEKVLTYEGIQATLELAKSENAKIVVIGNNKNGLPIMLQQ